MVSFESKYLNFSQYNLIKSNPLIKTACECSGCTKIFNQYSPSINTNLRQFLIKRRPGILQSMSLIHYHCFPVESVEYYHRLLLKLYHVLNLLANSCNLQSRNICNQFNPTNYFRYISLTLKGKLFPVNTSASKR